MRVILIVADGARPDTLRAAIDSGSLPSLAALRDSGGFHTITTAAPSVTGPAYAPFLLGRFPAPVGLPGLRWFDRSRNICRMPGHARSYVGFEMRYMDDDLAADAPTIFELASSSLAALSVIARGLPRGSRMGRGTRFALRTAFTHFRGNVRGWLDIDRGIARDFTRRVVQDEPAFAFAALTGIDKASHATGHESMIVGEALAIVDNLVGGLRSALEKSGGWESTHLWVVSDHGHSAVHEHEDLPRLLSDWGHHPRAHPWAYTPRGDVAVMVSGNAMAHLYLDLDTRERRWWPAMATRGEPLLAQLLALDSVDLAIVAHSSERVEVRSRRKGSAWIHCTGDRYSYEPRTGDPLGVGAVTNASRAEAHARTIASDYPDALVQIAALATAARSGDIIVSAARDWDFRAKYEPIPHVSSHGALHRDHMLVPLLTNRPPRRTPRRTVDLFSSAVEVLDLQAPAVVDGESFV